MRAAVPSAIAFGLVALGANCPPSAPPVCDAAACPTGYVRVCFDKCVRPVQPGGKCSLDLCADNGFCDQGGTCLYGTCYVAGQILGANCTPVPQADPCANDLFCRDHKACGGPKNLPPTCSAPVGLTGECDSNINFPACRPCEPGAECMNHRCRKPCEKDSDCPCDVQGEQTSYRCVLAPGDDQNACYRCAYAGKSCDLDHPCCDGSTCSNPAGGTCCWGNGHECAAGTCCGTDVCVPGPGGKNTCQVCKSIGTACTLGAQCCGGLVCKNGVCGKACPEGEPCYTGQPGVCAVGKWVCTRTGDATCVGPAPQTEVCDGKDNDCNGKVDDLPLKICTAHDIPNCQPEFNALGRYECVGDKPQCVSKPGFDYCNAPFVKLQNGASCGASKGAQCGGTFPMCKPTLLCYAEGNAPGICIDDPACSLQEPICWAAKWVGGSCCPKICGEDG